MKSLSIVLLALLVHAASSAQTPDSSVEGIAVEAGTNNGLSKVTLNLHSVADSNVQYAAVSAPDGRFAIRNIPPGKYLLGASRPGFVQAEYRKHGSSGDASILVIASGQHIADVRISMTPSGTISGRVLDRMGEPVAWAQMHVWKTTYPDGWRVSIPVDSQVANDLGEYRLFGLPPGQYYVSAQPDPRLYVRSPSYAGIAPTVPGAVVAGISAGMIGGVPDPANDSRISGADWSPVYFGQTTDEYAATAIELRVGNELRGIDITVDRIPMVSITGSIVEAATGKNVPQANIVFTSMASNPKFASYVDISVTGGKLSVRHVLPVRTSANGEFRTGTLVKGPYLATVVVDQQGRRLGGQAAVDLSDANVTGMKILVAPGAEISGRILFEGRPPDVADPDMAALRVGLTSTIDPIFDTSAATPAPSGSFTLRNITMGDYMFNVIPLSNLPSPLTPQSSQNDGSIPPDLKTTYVKSIRVGSVDILKDGLQLGSIPPGPIEVLIGTHPGVVGGLVVDGNQRILSGITVALLPEESQRNRIDLYRAIATDVSGRYRFERIPPGRYKLFAWEDVEKNSWRDSNFIRLYEDRGKTVTVREGAEESEDLTAIGMR